MPVRPKVLQKIATVPFPFNFWSLQHTIRCNPLWWRRSSYLFVLLVNFCRQIHQYNYNIKLLISSQCAEISIISTGNDFLLRFPFNLHIKKNFKLVAPESLSILIFGLNTEYNIMKIQDNDLGWFEKKRHISTHSRPCFME